MNRGLWLLVVAAGCRIGFDKRPPDGGDATGDSGDALVPPDFEPYWESSARYRARLLVPLEGGDPFWYGWHDTLLGMDCRNGIAADGLERCVYQDQRATAYYADAGCTQPLGWVRPLTCGQPGYVFNVDGMGRYHVYQTGATYAGTRYDAIGCTMTSGPTSGELVSLGAEVPASMMLDAQYTQRPVGEYERAMQGLRDGARVEIGTINTPIGSCFPLARSLGPAPCVGTQFRATPVYLDSNCSQRAYHWVRQSYDPTSTSLLAVYDTTACESSYRLFSVVTDVTAPMHYVPGPGNACNAVATGALDRLYLATETSDPMPMGTLVIGPRRGRLGYLYWVGPDGKAITTRYWDHDLGVPCLPINASDGTLRCLPTKDHVIDASPDATCTGASQPLVSACFGMPAVAGTTYVSCLDTFTVDALPQVATTVSTFGDSCTPIANPTGFFDPSQPGAEIPPSMFAEMMEIVE